MAPKRPTEEEASTAWVKSHFEAWEQARGTPQPRTTEEMKTLRTADAWGVQAAIARERARGEVDEQRGQTPGSSSQAGAARPAFTSPRLELDEAKALWKSLTNTAFGMAGEFEPQQHLSFVAGRPVVAIGPQRVTQSGAFYAEAPEPFARRPMPKRHSTCEDFRSPCVILVSRSDSSFFPRLPPASSGVFSKSGGKCKIFGNNEKYYCDVQ